MDKNENIGKYLGYVRFRVTAQRIVDWQSGRPGSKCFLHQGLTTIPHITWQLRLSVPCAVHGSRAGAASLPILGGSWGLSK